jgi:hypothetical protein
MKIECAKEINTIMLSVSDQLNRSVQIAKDNSDSANFGEYRKIIGNIMGLIYTDILSPIHKQYPSLIPDELKHG